MSLCVKKIRRSLSRCGHLLNLFQQKFGVQVDDQHPHLAALRPHHRRRNPNNRAFWLFYFSEFDVQVEWRHIYLSGVDRHGVTKIITVPLGLKIFTRNHVYPLWLAVNPNPFLAVGGNQSDLVNVGVKAGQCCILSLQSGQGGLLQPGVV